MGFVERYEHCCGEGAAADYLAASHWHLGRDDHSGMAGDAQHRGLVGIKDPNDVSENEGPHRSPSLVTGLWRHSRTLAQATLVAPGDYRSALHVGLQRGRENALNESHDLVATQLAACIVALVRHDG